MAKLPLSRPSCRPERSVVGFFANGGDMAAPSARPKPAGSFLLAAGTPVARRLGRSRRTGSRSTHMVMDLTQQRLDLVDLPLDRLQPLGMLTICARLGKFMVTRYFSMRSRVCFCAPALNPPA
jgi:hypothetical protein